MLEKDLKNTTQKVLSIKDRFYYFKTKNHSLKDHKEWKKKKLNKLEEDISNT